MNWNMGALNPSMSLEKIGGVRVAHLAQPVHDAGGAWDELSQAKILSMSTSCAAMRMSSRLSKCR